MMGARGVTDVSALAAKQALPTFLGYIKVTTDRIIYTYFLYNSLCFCASLSHCVCVRGCVWVYLNLCGQVLDVILWHVATTKHGPQPIRYNANWAKLYIHIYNTLIHTAHIYIYSTG